MEHLGRQLIMEFWGCNERINDPDAVRQVMTEAVAATGVTLLDLHIHTFHPQGVTGLAILAESHLSLHSWPEYEYLTADLFTCGDQARPEAAIAVMRQHFEPEEFDTVELLRGVGPGTKGRRRLERIENPKFSANW